MRRIEGARRSAAAEGAVDAVLADSFPASDPPSWTRSIAETRPRLAAVVEPLPIPSTGPPTWLQHLGSAALLLGIVFAVPIFIVGLPLAFAWRAVLAATKWRTA